MKYIKLGASALIIKRPSIILIKREKPPFLGFWTLPGGHVHYMESIDDAIEREVLEETDLRVKVLPNGVPYINEVHSEVGHYVVVTKVCYMEPNQ